MTLRQFEDFLYGACLLDWDREREQMRRIADRIDQATEVRLVADGTELVLGVEGRTCEVDDGHINMPGGEVFVSPLEDATEGLVTFSEYPATYFGHEVVGAWLAVRARTRDRRRRRAGRGLSARHPGHRPGRQRAGRARDRLQPGHHRGT